MITKNYEGIIKPKDYGDIEAGISMVIQHIYTHKMAPKSVFGMSSKDDNLLEIIFAENATGDFKIDSSSAVVTTNDCENIIIGLGELLMRLHLERMTKEGIKVTLNPDERTSSINYSPDSRLV